MGLHKTGDEGSRTKVDLIESSAATASIVCVVHCLALPVLVLALPAIGGFLSDARGFHCAMVAMIAPLALAALWLGHGQHGNVRPAILGIIGLSGLTAALLPMASHALETLLTIVASLLLVGAHLWNWRLRRCGA